MALQSADCTHQMQLVAGSGRCVSGGVDQAGGRMLAEGGALDGMQLLRGVISQHQPPPVLLDLRSAGFASDSRPQKMQRGMSLFNNKLLSSCRHAQVMQPSRQTGPVPARSSQRPLEFVYGLRNRLKSEDTSTVYVQAVL